ncbi:MAG: DUF2256 and DUF3253 domain-containing protein [Actinomycetota bacterium]
MARSQHRHRTGDGKPKGITSETASKVCMTCGRAITWRRKWAKTWNSVRYCSERCRRERPGGVDRDLERAILELLQSRPQNASICPSEAARRVDTEQWRQLMPQARSAARRLVASGSVVITQRGRKIEPSTATGPIRIQLALPMPPEPTLHRNRRAPK